MPKINPDSPKSVLAKVDSILQLFHISQPTLSLGQVVAQTQVRKSTAHRLLQELVDMGYLTLVREGYAPGLRLLELGMIAQETLGLGDILETAVSNLLTEFNETMTLATLRGEELVYLHVIQSSNPLQVVVRKGSRRPAQFGATGLALLACLPLAERDAFTTPTLPAFTANTQTDPTEWLQRLSQIEQRGYAVEYDEYVLGLGAIALPLKRNKPYALTIFGPTERLRAQEGQIIARLLGLHGTLLRRLPL
ncbi:MAG: IclR family transcriptional regulator C-terminal domain-containing protein [Chloroflexota bacterium]